MDHTGARPSPVEIRRACAGPARTHVSETQIEAARSTPHASSLLLVGTLALVWGCNWPVLKLGVTEIAPLTFRASTLAFAGIGLLVASRLSGESLRIPRRLWGKVIIMGLFN